MKTKTKTHRRYWRTPKAWNKRCGRCGELGAAAYPPADRSYVCETCIGRFGIKARESRQFRDGGAKTDAAVTVRYVDPRPVRGGVRDE